MGAAGKKKYRDAALTLRAYPGLGPGGPGDVSGELWYGLELNRDDALAYEASFAVRAAKTAQGQLDPLIVTALAGGDAKAATQVLRKAELDALEAKTIAMVGNLFGGVPVL